MTNATLTAENTSSTPASRKRRAVPTRNQLMALAALEEFPTKKAAREQLQAAGLQSSPRLVQELQELQAEFKRQRLSRAKRRIERRLGYVPQPVISTPATAPIILPAGTPQKRLSALRVREVAAVARRAIRYGAAGGSTMRVGFAGTASQVAYSVALETNWDTYRGAFKGWRAREDHHTIYVPRDWRIRVQRKGLATLGGLMTLDAHQLLPQGDIQLFSATWASQGRGFDVNVDRGFIALLDGQHFHACSMEAALKGIRRKVASKPRGAPALALSVEDFVSRYWCHSARVRVSVADAENSGSCDYGIRSWCESVGIAYGDGEVSLERVLEGFRVLPQEEVRRAVLHAVRRHRSERKRFGASMPGQAERRATSGSGL